VKQALYRKQCYPRFKQAKRRKRWRYSTYTKFKKCAVFILKQTVFCKRITSELLAS